MKQHKLNINIALSVIQVVLMGISSFIVYKIVLKNLGSEVLGIWSLVFSISSIANIANLGVANSLIKFIAVYHTEGNWRKINQLVGTGFYVVTALMSVTIFLLYFFKEELIPFLLTKVNTFEIANNLMPLSLISLWINTVSAIFLSVLDGFKETYIKNLLYIISSLIYVVLTFLLIDDYGIIGLGYSQVLQGVILLIGSIIVVYTNRNMSLKMLIYKKEAFDEIFSYSYKFQLVTIITIVIEPIIKFYLSRFSGLSSVGFFEMANKLVTQVRQILVAANQAIIPYIAEKQSSKIFIINFYKKNFYLISIFAFLTLGSVIIFSSIISRLWLGEERVFFISSVIILSVAQIVNLHTLPANFTNLGTGNISHLIYTSITICLSNIIFGYFFGINFGEYGVIMGWGGSIVLGSLLQMYLFRHEYRISYNELYDNSFLKIIIQYIVVIFLMLYCLVYNLNQIIFLSIGMLILLLLSFRNLKPYYKIFNVASFKN